jgi:hypothetical protein
MKTRRRPLEPHGDFVNHLWQVAHGRLPIQAYDPQTRRTARPWLTTITDAYSHCVVGFHRREFRALRVPEADAHARFGRHRRRRGPIHGSGARSKRHFFEVGAAVRRRRTAVHRSVRRHGSVRLRQSFDRDGEGSSRQNEVTKYSRGVRNHARVVIIALSVALIGTVTFAVNRLFASSASPESAVTAAADFVSNQTKLTTDRIHFAGMVADNDAYVVTFSVPTIGNDFTVRVAKKDGSVTQVAQQKKP